MLTGLAQWDISDSEEDETMKLSQLQSRLVQATPLPPLRQRFNGSPLFINYNDCSSDEEDRPALKLCNNSNGEPGGIISNSLIVSKRSRVALSAAPTGQTTLAPRKLTNMGDILYLPIERNVGLKEKMSTIRCCAQDILHIGLTLSILLSLFLSFVAFWRDVAKEIFIAANDQNIDAGLCSHEYAINRCSTLNIPHTRKLCEKWSQCMKGNHAAGLGLSKIISRLSAEAIEEFFDALSLRTLVVAVLFIISAILARYIFSQHATAQSKQQRVQHTSSSDINRNSGQKCIANR